MKNNKKRIICIALALLMVLSLAACGKEKAPADPNLINIGKYDVLYKGAYLTTDCDGDDAIVVKLDFTNNSDSASTYGWTVFEKVTQDGVELSMTTVYPDIDSFEDVTTGNFDDVEAGDTKEICIAYLLNDTTTDVIVGLSDLWDDYTGSITISPSSLEFVTGYTSDDVYFYDGEDLVEYDILDSSILDWWNGDWYGWWIMNECTGVYEPANNYWWDCLCTIDVGSDCVGSLIITDADFTADDPVCDATISIIDNGAGEYGTLNSELGWFMDATLNTGDWVVDPALEQYDNLIHLSGWYYSDDGDYHYDVYLRPWGVIWDDVSEDSLPELYYTWYLPLVEQGADMPEAIPTDAY